MLNDGQWHCPTNELYMKDDRKRLSELNQIGFQIIGEKCNLGHNHNSRVLMRKLVKQVDWWRLPQYQSPKQTVPSRLF